MTLTHAAARAIATLPGYMLPCPAGSVLLTDPLWRTPGASHGKRSGVLLFSACGCACPFCRGFQARHRLGGGGMSFAGVEAMADVWNDAVMEAASEAFADALKKSGRGL